MSFEAFFKVFSWISTIITILAVLFFLWSFFRLKEKSYSQYMILILTIADFGYPLKITFDYYFVRDITSAYIMTYFGIYIYRWSLYWSAIIGIFTHKLLTQDFTFNPKRFMIKAIVWCTILSAAAPLM